MSQERTALPWSALSGFQELYELQRVEQFGSQELPALQWPGQFQELAELPLGGQLVFQLQAVGTGWVPEGVPGALGALAVGMVRVLGSSGAPALGAV